ncbi:MAG: hypothetical protein MJ141_05020, partial [Clostridia bacterium]|nr:hypothetical protein [Clostridia bacterium]
MVEDVLIEYLALGVAPNDGCDLAFHVCLERIEIIVQRCFLPDSLEPALQIGTLSVVFFVHHSHFLLGNGS